MLLEAAKCPQCGADVRISAEADRVHCDYCKRDILIRAGGSNSPNVVNLLKLADAALDADNFDEAYGYYTRVLEDDPDNVLGWFGKAIAAGWSSNLRRDRFKELLSGVERAITLAHNDIKPTLRKRAGLSVANVGTSLFRLSFEHMLEYAALDDAWPEHVARSRVILIGMDVAHSLAPSERIIMDSALMIAHQLLEGVEYTDKYNTDEEGDPTTGYHHLDPRQTEEVRALFDTWVERIKKVDPSFEAPKIKEVGPGTFSSCLIGLLCLVGLGALGYGAWWVITMLMR